ncbi:MAG: phosphoribosyl-ATP diphosphatase [Burkholderiaceae bacterium]|jgi:phosphoribosyl-ATP pyrophosphohydrolase|nr:phosphoribosyl-ATP diphosphatase [Burkholderiaceae bacterium]
MTVAASPDPDAVLARLTQVIESRLPARGGDPERSYVARLLAKGPDAFLKKIGEEAAEVIMAAKDAERAGADAGDNKTHLIAEMADLWFHGMVALAYYGCSAADVTAELARREGLSGLEEKALRKARAREDRTIQA